MADTKRCSSCNIVKPVAEFHRNRSNSDGLHAQCKSCRKQEPSRDPAKRKKYRDKNRLKIREQNKAYRLRDPEHFRKLDRESYQRNRSKRIEKSRRYREENPDKVREITERYRDRNKDSIREYMKDYLPKYYRKNPDVFRSARHRRRVRKKNLPTENFNVADIYDRDEWVCQLCGDLVDPDRKWPDPWSVSLDHVTPISDPTCPGHVWENVWTTHLRCNLSKGDRSIN